MKFEESEIIELKLKYVDDILKVIISFVNTKGGKLYIGIKDNGDVIGVENPDDELLRITNSVRDNIKPDVTMFLSYNILEIQSKKIIEVIVQKGVSRPYYLSSKGLKISGVYVRNGTSSEPASDILIRKMIKDVDCECYEMMDSFEQNLHFETLRKLFSKKNIILDDSKMKTLGLKGEGNRFSNVAYFLSDECSNSIKIAVFSGKDKSVFQDRRDFSGSLLKQMEEAYSYLEIHNRTKSTFKGLYRNDQKDYPEEALREVLLNSLVHRDYSYSASTLISIYDDRIEFVSIGGLMYGITLEDILLGVSVCRNQKLANIFYRLELIEAYGTGLQKVFNSYSSYKMKPKINVTQNAFKVTLPNLNYEKKTESIQKVTYTPYVNGVLLCFDSSSRVTRSDVEKQLNVSQATANRVLKQMIESDLITPEGNGKRIIYRRKFHS